MTETISRKYKYPYIREHIEEFKKDYIDGILTQEELEEKYRCPKSCYYGIVQRLNIKRKTIYEQTDIEDLINDLENINI